MNILTRLYKLTTNGINLNPRFRKDAFPKPYGTIGIRIYFIKLMK
jgi:hypothetical protein